MSMKRFSILFILIVFVTVSCAGPNKVGWTKPDFHQDEFEKDRKQCIQTLDERLDPAAFGKALEECLAKKRYKYETSPESSAENRKKVLTIIGLSVGVILCATVVGALVYLIYHPSI